MLLLCIYCIIRSLILTPFGRRWLCCEGGSTSGRPYL